MSLLEKINSELGDALKSGDKLRLSVLRLLKTALVSGNKTASQKNLSEEEEGAILKKQAKQTEDAISLYEKNNQLGRAQEERLELKIIESYLPKEMPDSEIETVATEVINNLEPNLRNNFGKVMGAVMSRLQGKAGGDRVAAIVRRKLNL